MSTSDWFAKKLGTQPPQPSAPGPQAPAYQPPAQQPQQVPPQQPADPNKPPPPGAPGTLSHALQDPNLQTKGDQAARTEHELCPACNSNNYFSRTNALGGVGVAPRKHCYDCGYPLVQYGSPTGEGGLKQQLGAGGA